MLWGQEIDAFRQCEVDPDAEIALSVFRASTFRKPSVFRWNSCAVWDKTSPRNASQHVSAKFLRRFLE